jgi:hypothetical protein
MNPITDLISDMIYIFLPYLFRLFVRPYTDFPSHTSSHRLMRLNHGLDTPSRGTVELIPLILCKKCPTEARRSPESSEFESRENLRKVESVRISSGKVREVRGSSEKSKKHSVESNEFESQRTSTKGEEGRGKWQKLEECRKRNRGNRANSKITGRRRTLNKVEKRHVQSR